MSYRNRHLQSMLTGESRAYGFTIAFWGSGALLINEFGAPDIVLALCYGIGGVLGFGLLAFSVLKNGSEKSDEALLVLSTVHYISALAPMLVTHGVITLGLRPEITFLLGGMSVSLLYNLLSILEESIAEKAQELID